uniref:Peptide PGLa-BM2 n=1 Tax=Xenopus boumbaensis TaxID=288550 RepID=PGBM2_XENBM|nr:RecName: Full=Peptide PGLa-BM2 [Xenopus boumbaensis]
GMASKAGQVLGKLAKVAIGAA